MLGVGEPSGTEPGEGALILHSFASGWADSARFREFADDG